jgi:two-component system response regulator VanR
MEAGKKKILIIDDDQEAVKMLGLILEDAGYKVSAAYTGAEALKEIEKDGIDLVLLDVIMPDMDGYTFFQTLRSDISKKDLPVIVVTGRPGMKEIFKIEGVSVVIDNLSSLKYC